VPHTHTQTALHTLTHLQTLANCHWKCQMCCVKCPQM